MHIYYYVFHQAVNSIAEQILISVRIKDLPYIMMKFILNDLDVNKWGPWAVPLFWPRISLYKCLSEDLSGMPNQRTILSTRFMWMMVIRFWIPNLICLTSELLSPTWGPLGPDLVHWAAFNTLNQAVLLRRPPCILI